MRTTSASGSPGSFDRRGNLRVGLGVRELLVGDIQICDAALEALFAGISGHRNSLENKGIRGGRFVGPNRNIVSEAKAIPSDCCQLAVRTAEYEVKRLLAVSVALITGGDDGLDAADYAAHCSGIPARMTDTRVRTRGGRLQMQRSRGAMSGLLLILLGAWGALAPFVGPYFDFAFSPDRAWAWTEARGWLQVLPGAVAVVGGAAAAGLA